MQPTHEQETKVKYQSVCSDDEEKDNYQKGSHYARASPVLQHTNIVSGCVSVLVGGSVVATPINNLRPSCWKLGFGLIYAGILPEMCVNEVELRSIYMGIQNLLAAVCSRHPRYSPQ
jgi:uncharacterized membrane protein HdeD (DUF308 family)